MREGDRRKRERKELDDNHKQRPNDFKTSVVISGIEYEVLKKGLMQSCQSKDGGRTSSMLWDVPIKKAYLCEIRIVRGRKKT